MTKTEPMIAKEFDEIIESTGFFNMYKEVWGYNLQPNLGTELKRFRIDRILIPTNKLKSQGWIHGIIGIELKAEDKKVGKPILQILDYLKSAFRIEINNSYFASIMLDTCFLYPHENFTGSLESITKQNRIGTGETTKYHKLKLKFGGINFLTIDSHNNVEFDRKPLLFGKKSGSR